MDERGRVWISDVGLSKQERVLLACITSFHANESDLACLLEEIEYARQRKREQHMDLIPTSRFLLSRQAKQEIQQRGGPPASQKS